MENNYFYSPSTNGFYLDSMNTEIPDDAKKITEEKYNHLLSGQESGKVIASDSDGNPVLEDAPALTAEQEVRIAEKKKNDILSNANTYTQPWQTQLLLGIISDEDKASLTTWMKYYQKVQAVDTSTAPKIKWPVKPE